MPAETCYISNKSQYKLDSHLKTYHRSIKPSGIIYDYSSTNHESTNSEKKSIHTYSENHGTYWNQDCFERPGLKDMFECPVSTCYIINESQYELDIHTRKYHNKNIENITESPLRPLNNPKCPLRNCNKLHDLSPKSPEEIINYISNDGFPRCPIQNCNKPHGSQLTVDDHIVAKHKETKPSQAWYATQGKKKFCSHHKESQCLEEEVNQEQNVDIMLNYNKCTQSSKQCINCRISQT